MNSKNFALEFLKLQEKYLINFQEKLLKIEDCLKNHDQESLADHFHKLKGNGQTYGFKSITDIATLVDQHYKIKSPDYLHWATIGLSLLKEIHPLLINKTTIDLNQITNYSKLINSIKPLNGKGEQ